MYRSDLETDRTLPINLRFPAWITFSMGRSKQGIFALMATLGLLQQHSVIVQVLSGVCTVETEKLFNGQMIPITS